MPLNSEPNNWTQGQELVTTCIAIELTYTVSFLISGFV